MQNGKESPVPGIKYRESNTARPNKSLNSSIRYNRCERFFRRDKPGNPDVDLLRYKSECKDWERSNFHEDTIKIFDSTTSVLFKRYEYLKVSGKPKHMINSSLNDLTLLLRHHKSLLIFTEQNKDNIQRATRGYLKDIASNGDGLSDDEIDFLLNEPGADIYGAVISSLIISLAKEIEKAGDSITDESFTEITNRFDHELSMGL